MKNNNNLAIEKPSLKNPPKSEIQPLRNVHKALGLHKLKSYRNRRFMWADLILGTLGVGSLVSLYKQNPLGVFEVKVLNKVVEFAYDTNNELLGQVVLGGTIYVAPIVVAGCFVASFLHMRRSKIFKSKEAGKDINSLLKYHFWSDPAKYLEQGALVLKSEFSAKDLTLDEAKEIVSRQALRHAQDRQKWHNSKGKILSAENEVVKAEILQKQTEKLEKERAEQERIDAKKREKELESDAFKGDDSIPTIEINLDDDGVVVAVETTEKKKEEKNTVVVGYEPNDKEFEYSK